MKQVLDIAVENVTFEVQGCFYKGFVSQSSTEPSEDASFEISAVWLANQNITEHLAEWVLDSLQVKAVEACRDE